MSIKELLVVLGRILNLFKFALGIDQLRAATNDCRLVLGDEALRGLAPNQGRQAQHCDGVLRTSSRQTHPVILRGMHICERGLSALNFVLYMSYTVEQSSNYTVTGDYIELHIQGFER